MLDSWTNEPGCRRNSNSFVENQTKSTVGRVTAFVSEKVVHYVIDDREQGTARLVDRSVFTVGAQSALGPGSWK